MRVHQRSCHYQEPPKRKSNTSRKDNCSSPAPLGRIVRLRCDRETFCNEDMGINSSPLPPIEQDMLSIIKNATRNEGNDTAKLSEENSLLTSTMLSLAKVSRKSGRNLVDDIIKTITNPAFPLQTLQNVCRSTRDCIKLEDSLFEEEMSGMGFRRILIYNDDHTVTCDLYLRSPIEVLSSQILASSSYSTLFNGPTNDVGTEKFCHPMSAHLGTKGEQVVMRTVMSNKDSGAIWHDGITTAEHSFAGMVQLYSDKSRTSLKESSFQFYPMHATLLNFSEQHRRQCIVEGKTVIAFLPVKFYSTEKTNQIEINLPRDKYLTMLHKCMATAVKELRLSGLEGFPCKDREGILRRCHPVIASYCSDLPECKDILPVKNGNTSTRNCHRCLALSEKFNEQTNAPKRDGNLTIKLIIKARELRLNGKVEEANKLLSDYSLIEMIPFLEDFPFVGLDPVLDMHYIFSFEPLHNLFLGISKLLKACLSERLRSAILQTSAIRTRGGNVRTVNFRTVRMIVLTGINRLLSHIQRLSPLNGVRIDFSKGGSSGHEKGLYGQEGNLIGMLEGKDYRNLDFIFPFVGMFVDRVCDEVSTAVSTELFVLYAEILRMSLSYSSDDSLMWNEAKIRDLENKVSKFKKMATQLYGSFHPSKLRTEKMHMLDHIGDDIRRLGGLRYCDAGLYEYSHTIVKAAHRATSRRRNSAMSETIALYCKDINSALLRRGGDVCNDGSQPLSKRSLNAPRQLPKVLSAAIQQDCATLVSNGKIITVSEIDRVRRLIRRRRIAVASKEEKVVKQMDMALTSAEKSARDLVQDIGETASRILYRELLEKLTRTRDHNYRGSDSFKITQVASGYVNGICTPTSKDLLGNSNRVVVDESKARKYQRFVSTRGFYNNPGLRQDCVLIQAPGTSENGKVNVWFGKVLGLFRASSSRQSSSQSISEEYEEQFAFVQFFEVKLPQDEIDKALGCVRLTWARGDELIERRNGIGASNEEKERKWFTLLPVSTIRGVVHVVRGDYGIKSKCVWTDMEDVSWEEQHFYVNRFKFETNGVERNYTEYR